MGDISYESHSPLRHIEPIGQDATITRIDELVAARSRLYEEQDANYREYADLAHRVRVMDAEIDRFRFKVLRHAGLDEEAPNA